MKTLLVVCAVLFAVLTISSSAAAQKRPGPAPGPAPAPNTSPSAGAPVDRTNRQSAYDLEMLADGKVRTEEEKKKARLALEQIREDFMRIQVINNDLLAAAAKPAAAAAGDVMKAAGELNKRAKRLQTNLALPPPPKKDEPAAPDTGAAPADIGKQIRQLDAGIQAFVNNGMFRSTDIIDAQLSVEASATLRGIIEGSQTLRADAERIRNSNKGDKTKKP